MTKRVQTSLGSEDPTAKRHHVQKLPTNNSSTVPPTSRDAGYLSIANVADGETVHQRCLIITGAYAPTDTAVDEDYVTVHTYDASGTVAFPAQSWPVVGGRIKILVMLSPGLNKLSIRRESSPDHEISINYLPLLQSPPLHLAIMIAKDSPLLIDCPPRKQGAISSAHASLEAAIAKLRMSAYMWQALTAEDMRSKGLGRRSFRLEEEWTADTTSREFMNGLHESALYQNGAMRSTAKIHLIKSDKTTAELRDPNVAQQNNSAHSKDKLFDYFQDALKAHGSPFEASAHPIVAGMILDSHYSFHQRLILAHAALGCHNPRGLSLGMFGSHLTYAWPRFVEEVSDCLLDTRPPGDTVGNDNGECGSFWEACSIGQGAFLHEVGHAFGAPHTTGIMARGYAQHWPRNFVTQTAYCSQLNQEGFVVIDGETENNACWDIRDALSFKHLPHFWLPGDPFFSAQQLSVSPTTSVVDSEKGPIELEISSELGVARIQFNGNTESTPSVLAPLKKASYPLADLEARFPRDQPLKLNILGTNGKSKVIGNAWRLFNSATYIRIPGSNIKLNKFSIACNALEDEDDDDENKKWWKWATLLTQRKEDGTISHATEVDVRTGCVLDGAYVYFEDGTRINCGPRIHRWGGGRKDFGGHASESIKIPQGQRIVKVEVARDEGELRGMRMHLENGTAKGALSGDDYDTPETCVLEPPQDERIVGFFGTSFWGENFDCLAEFGIITAPLDFELPEVVYNMPELKNTDGGIKGVDPNSDDYNDDDDDNDEEMEEDEE